MSTTQASFTVKSTHRFVNPSAQETLAPPPPPDYYYSPSSSSIKSQLPKSYTNIDTNRKEGSTEGMAIRVTNTSVEDFY